MIKGLENFNFIKINTACQHCQYYDNNKCNNKDNCFWKTLEQALIKSQEQEKVLEIINEYQVDIWLLKQCDYENYIRIRKEAMISTGEIVNENGIILEDEITEKEFNTIKKWIK